MIRRRLLLPLVLATLFVAPVRAQDYVVDQGCQPEVWALYSIAHYGPLVQEFVPGLHVLDVVEVWVTNPEGGPGSSLQVRVRADSLGGALLGGSDTLSVPTPHDGRLRFGFSTPVTLTPGVIHVLELVRVSGEGNPMLGAGDSQPYPAGRAFVKGANPLSIDFWFVTGATPGVPTVARSWGALKTAYR